MNDAQLEAAKGLKQHIRKIRWELETWEKDLTTPRRLAYMQGSNGNAERIYDARDLESSVPVDIFEGFRAAAIASLQLQLQNLERQFNGL